MSPDIAVELIKLVPSALWIVFVAILIAVFYKPIKRDLLPRMSGFRAFGVELAFVQEELNQAIDKQDAEVSMDDRSQVLRRAQRVAPVLRGARILWVDDNPDFNTYERSMLQSLGILVDIALSTDKALEMLRRTEYHAVISDMKREGVADEGLQFVEKMRQQGLYRWTILYIGSLNRLKGTPPYVFGITNRPDHLLHYVMDVLERERS
jgi:CheY-like chemotaxis protein